jgi:hypothetical protein
VHPLILTLAVGSQLLMPVSDRIPELNVAATCKGSVEADKAMGLALPQSFDQCMSDENSALQQLRPVWSSYSDSIQATCQGEASAGGNGSYVDLLTCLQMTGSPGTVPVTTLRGASKKRTPK